MNKKFPIRFFKNIKYRILINSIFSLLLFSLFFSCTKKTVNVIKAKPGHETYYGKVDTLAVKATETFEEAINPIEKTPPTILIPEDYLVASLKKTECYGHCPTFTFKIFANGKAIYKGEKYVDWFGNFVANVDEATLERIKAKGESLGISQLEETYPTNHFFIQDLPMTFISFHNGLKAKLIRNNYDAPKALLGYEKFLEEIIQELEWKRADSP